MKKLSTPLLTISDLRDWRAEDDMLLQKMKRLGAEIDEIKQKREEIGERLQFAAKLFGDIDELIGEASESPVVQAPKNKKDSQRPTDRIAKGSWTSTIYRLVKGADQPISYDDLREMIMQTHLADTLGKTDKSFYGAIARLANSEKIVREAGYVFSPKAYAKFRSELKSGTAAPLPKISYAHNSPTADAIMAYLKQHPIYGASSSEIISHLKTTDVREQIERNKTFPYNVLSRMKERGEIVKSGNRYRLPDENGEAVASPETDEVAASSINNPAASGPK